MAKSEFMLGDRVTWASSAAGSTTTKRGIVIEVVAPGKRPTKYAHAGVRDIKSYVVSVPRKAKDGSELKPEIYWPVVSLLRGAAGRKSKAQLAMARI